MPWLRALVVASLTLLSSCYCILGEEHNDTAVDHLEVGMPRDQCLDLLAAGGGIKIDQEIASGPDQEWSDLIEEPEALERFTNFGPEKIQRITRALRVHRVWGFAGFGVIYLFLDSEDRLVAYLLKHVN